MTGEELRAYRESRQLGQQEFAQYLNEKLNRKYDRNKISRWETGGEKVPDVVEMLLRERQHKPPRAARAQVVAIANQKGGVAKTTTSLNVAYLLAKDGVRVLVVDCDPQGSATIHLGVRPDRCDAEGKTLAHMLDTDLPTVDAIVPVCDGLFDLVPSSISLADTEAKLTSDPTGGLALGNKLEEVGDRYDIIILDCPPNLGLMSVSGLIAADGLVIPCQTEMLSVMGLTGLLKTVSRVRRRTKHPLAMIGIVPTLFNARRSADQEMLRHMEQFAKNSGYRLFTPVRDVADYGKAVMDGKVAVQLSPNVAGAETYAEIAQAITGALLSKEAVDAAA